MGQVYAHMYEITNILPDWLKHHITPEAFLTCKLENNRYTYEFKKLKEVQRALGTGFHFILYEQVKRKLKHLIDVCNEAQCPIANTFPLTLPMEHSLLQVNKKGCTHLRKMYRKMIEFDINDWKHMQNGTEMSVQFGVNYTPYEAEKIIS